MKILENIVIKSPGDVGAKLGNHSVPIGYITLPTPGNEAQKWNRYKESLKKENQGTKIRY